jgi:hypothetical protein
MLCGSRVAPVNSYLAAELAQTTHRQLLDDQARAGLAAVARRRRRADRFARRAASLTTRAAQLVERSHR